VGVTSVAFLPDGASVVSGGGSNTIGLWDAATGSLIRTFEGHTIPVSSVAFSSDGARVLSGSWDKTTKLWDVASGALIRTFVGHSASVSSVAFAPDGTRVSSGDGKTFKLWDTATGELVSSFEGCNRGGSMAFSPDGTRVLCGGNDKTIKLWDAATSALIRTFEAHPDSVHSDGVHSLAFSPDGARVLSGGGKSSYSPLEPKKRRAEATVKLWDVATGALVRSFKGPISEVTSLTFSPDGTRVLSGNLDQTIKMWDGSEDAQYARTRARVRALRPKAPAAQWRGGRPRTWQWT
jgi:eukaryotic-like serine/threonine-protein kinase